MPDWLKIYHHLPYHMKVLAASVHGYYLRWWRYGPETEHLVEEALERDTWSPERWKTWQEERLAYVLERAATRVPYYRDYWRRRRQRGDHASWTCLENWPILKKEELRRHPELFIADNCNIKRMFRDHTGGTTGTPLSIYLKRDTLHNWYALFEARLRRWCDVSWQERWAILGGQLVIPFAQTKPPFWVYNAGLNQLYLSTHHLSIQNAKSYTEGLHKYAPSHMIVYPSSAAVLASFILRQQLKISGLHVIFSNAELLLDSQREVISKAFGCPVRNTYGAGEYVVGASECENGLMHVWPEAGVIEVLDDCEDKPLKNGRAGRLILTGLLNADMPLIRYEIGDRGGQHAGLEGCACKRNLPLLSKLEGRMNDLLVTADGRRIYWLNAVVYELPLVEAQIIQESFDKIRVRYVPAEDYCSRDGDLIAERIQARVGRVQVLLEPMDAIPRGFNGKFRYVVCKIPKEDLKACGVNLP